MPQQSRLIPRLREAMRTRRYSLKTEKAYVHWVRRYIFFHKLRHPKDVGPVEVTAFLNHLANERKVSASTQNQALAALLFFYRHLLTHSPGSLVSKPSPACGLNDRSCIFRRTGLGR